MKKGLCLLMICAGVVSASPTRLLPGDGLVKLAAGDQQSPALAAGGGITLAVWADERANPTSDYEYETSGDIYGMRFDASGNALDALPFPIAVGPSSQTSPRAAWNGRYFLVTWDENGLNGLGYSPATYIRGVRVETDGSVVDEEPITIFRHGTSSSAMYSLASDGENWALITQGSDSGENDIVGVRVGPDGSLLDPSPTLVLAAEYYLRFDLRLVGANGMYLMAWEDRDDIQGQRLASTLHPIDTTPLTLVGDYDGSVQLAADDSGFYGVWSAQLPDFSVAVLGARIGRDGSLPDGTGVNISQSNPPNGSYVTPQVVWDGQYWKTAWKHDNTLYVARVNTSGGVVDPGGTALPGPALGMIAPTPPGGLQVVWTDYANSNYDIFTAHISSSNTAGSPQDVSISASRQWDCRIAAGANGFMLVYRSSPSVGARILAQPLDATGQPLTVEPVELDSTLSPNTLGTPGVDWNGSLYMATWLGTNGVVAQRLQEDGTKIDASPFLVSDDMFGAARIAALDGDFLITGRKYTIGIHFVHPVGVRVRGSDAAVLDATPLVLGQYYARTVLPVALGDHWLVAWHGSATHDNGNASYTKSVFVPKTGTLLSAVATHNYFSINGGNSIFELGLASNGEKALLVQSQELTSGVETDLRAWVLDTNATTTAINVLTPWPGNQYRPQVAWDGTHFIVAYQDQKNRDAPHTLDEFDARSDLFGIRILPDATVVDTNGFVISALPTSESHPALASKNGRTLFAGSFLLNDGTNENYRIATELVDVSLNQWPVAVADADVVSGIAPLTIQFNSTGSLDPDGSIVAYEWDFDNGAVAHVTDPVRTFFVAGTYVVKLTVTDDDGAQTTQTLFIKASNQNQLPLAAASADVTGGKAPLSVVFSSTGSFDPDGSIGNKEWIFGDDGSVYWGSPAYHTFTAPGTYTATLTVFDASGDTGSDVLTITVAEPGTTTVSAFVKDGYASEAPDHGVFRLHRDSNVGDLTVHYTLGGAATEGTDYDALSGSAVIADGKEDKTVTITPVDDALAEGVESVELTVSANPAYSVDLARSVVQFDIADNEPVPPADGDGDEMDDEWEIDNFGGTNVVNGGATEDWDGDGVINLHEFLAGTDPVNPDSLLHVSGMSPGGNPGELVLTWPAVERKTYAVLYKTNISDPVWMLHEVNIPGTEPECSHTVNVESSSAYFQILLQY